MSALHQIDFKYDLGSDRGQVALASGALQSAEGASVRQECVCLGSPSHRPGLPPTDQMLLVTGDRLTYDVYSARTGLLSDHFHSYCQVFYHRWAHWKLCSDTEEPYNCPKLLLDALIKCSVFSPLGTNLLFTALFLVNYLLNFVIHIFKWKGNVQGS